MLDDVKDTLKTGEGAVTDVQGFKWKKNARTLFQHGDVPNVRDDEGRVRETYDPLEIDANGFVSHSVVCGFGNTNAEIQFSLGKVPQLVVCSQSTDRSSYVSEKIAMGKVPATPEEKTATCSVIPLKLQDKITPATINNIYYAAFVLTEDGKGAILGGVKHPEVAKAGADHKRIIGLITVVQYDANKYYVIANNYAFTDTNWPCKEKMTLAVKKEETEWIKEGNRRVVYLTVPELTQVNPLVLHPEKSPYSVEEQEKVRNGMLQLDALDVENYYESRKTELLFIHAQLLKPADHFFSNEVLEVINSLLGRLTVDDVRQNFANHPFLIFRIPERTRQYTFLSPEVATFLNAMYTNSLEVGKDEFKAVEQEIEINPTALCNCFLLCDSFVLNSFLNSAHFHEESWRKIIRDLYSSTFLGDHNTTVNSEVVSDNFSEGRVDTFRYTGENTFFEPLPSGVTVLEHAYAQWDKFLQENKDDTLYLPFRDHIAPSLRHINKRANGERVKLLALAEKIILLRWNKVRTDFDLKKLQAGILRQLDIEALDSENAHGLPMNYQSKDALPIAKHMAPTLVKRMTDTSVQGEVLREVRSLIHTLFLNAYSRRVLMDELVSQSEKVIPFFEKSLESYNTEGVAFNILDKLADLPDELYNTASLVRRDSGIVCRTLLSLYRRLGTRYADHLRFYEYIHSMNFTVTASLNHDLEDKIQGPHAKIEDEHSSMLATLFRGTDDVARSVPHAFQAVFGMGYSVATIDVAKISPESFIQIEQKKYLCAHTLNEWLKRNRGNRDAVLRMYQTILHNEAMMNVFAQTIKFYNDVNALPNDEARKWSARTRTELLSALTFLSDVLPQQMRQNFHYERYELFSMNHSLTYLATLDINQLVRELKIDGNEREYLDKAQATTKRLLKNVPGYVSVFTIDASEAGFEGQFDTFFGKRNEEITYVLADVKGNGHHAMQEAFFETLNRVLCVREEPFLSCLLKKLEKILTEDLTSDERKKVKEHIRLQDAFNTLSNTHGSFKASIMFLKLKAFMALPF